MSRYIILASNSVGGAEKRFFDIFISLREQKEDVFFVAPTMLLEKLNCSGIDNIIEIKMNSWSYIKFIFKLYLVLIIKCSNNDFFHYPLNPPFFLHVFTHRNISISYCYCYSKPKISISSLGLSLQKLASYFVKKIDVLSPTVYSNFNNNEKYSLTPGGTFVSKSSYNTLGIKNEIAIISRLENGKGIDSFFKLVEKIKKNSSFDASQLKFRIYGDGSLKKWVVDKVSICINQGIDVEYMGYLPSESIMQNVGLILSLQSETNYPSRVVVEGLLSGSRVLVLASGDSRSFGEQIGLFYLEPNFSNLDDILKSLSSVELDDELRKKIALNAMFSFSHDSYIDYYKRVMS
ncbi:glycosyltransferase [Vibrio cholerae]